MQATIKTWKLIAILLGANRFAYLSWRTPPRSRQGARAFRSLSKSPKDLIFQLSLKTSFQLISTAIRFVTPGFHTSLSPPSRCRCHRVPELDPPASYTPHQAFLHASARRRSLRLQPSQSCRRCTEANSPHHEAVTV